MKVSRTVNVDVEVFEALRRRFNGQANTHNRLLRILLGLPPSKTRGGQRKVHNQNNNKMAS